MQKRSLPEQAIRVVRDRHPNAHALVGLVLGSGLDAYATHIKDRVSFDYADLPGFPTCQVAGHPGTLHLGTLCGVPVACLQGRIHYYESFQSDDFKTPIRTLKLLGCETIIITNASGSLRPAIEPGQLIVIKDHINFQGRNPLAGGPNDEDFGSRFVNMDAAYDPALRATTKKLAQKLAIPVAEGIYMGVLGPLFETPAEIRLFQAWGADVIGMSSLSDVIVARHCDMRVLLVAAISNRAAGTSDVPVSHALTLEGAKKSLDNLMRLMNALLPQLAATKEGSSDAFH